MLLNTTPHPPLLNPSTSKYHPPHFLKLSIRFSLVFKRPNSHFYDFEEIILQLHCLSLFILQQKWRWRHFSGYHSCIPIYRNKKKHQNFMFHVVGGALLCPQGLGEISSKCTIPAHDKAVRGIGGEITRGSSPLLRLHIIQPPSDPPTSGIASTSNHWFWRRKNHFTLSLSAPFHKTKTIPGSLMQLMWSFKLCFDFEEEKTHHGSTERTEAYFSKVFLLKGKFTFQSCSISRKGERSSCGIASFTTSDLSQIISLQLLQSHCN